MDLLIIDDEPIFRRGLTKTIEKKTHCFDTIYQAENAQQAFAIMEEKSSITAIFADINLPDMNGLDLIEKIQLIRPDVLITVISGYDDFHYARQAIHLKVFDYLLKPVAPSDIQYLLTQLSKELIVSTTIRTVTDDSPLSSLCSSAIAYIEAYYAAPDISLSKVSEDLFVNASYLSKQMKKNTGKSFNEYLIAYRIDKAKELLAQNTIRYSIQEIGERVGYANQHYFSRIFKQQTNMTPSQYREAHL